MKHNTAVVLLALASLLLAGATNSLAQVMHRLTLDQSLAIGLNRSQQAKQLEQSLLNSRMSLKAAEASFKSFGELVFSSLPNLRQGISQTQIGTGEFVFPRQNFVDMQAELFVNQPLAMTDGVISLVGVMQRFHQSITTSIDVGGTPFEQRTSSTTYLPQLRLQFRQPLFTLNRLKTNYRKADLNLENTLQTYSRSQLDIIYNVTSAFYNLFRLQQQLAIDQAQAQQSENAFHLARLKQQAGLFPELEVLRLEVEMANARNTLANSRANLQRTEDSFKLLIGLPMEDSVRVVTELTYRPIQVVLERALAEALQRRTELRSDEIAVQLSEISVAETDAASEITGELYASYGLLNEEKKFRDAFQKFDTDRSVKLALSVPLWDWGKNGAEVQAARAALQSDRLTQQNRTEAIKQEIRDAVRNLESAQQRLEITRRSEELAEKSYRISLLKFESGDLSSQDLALEQNRLTQARTNSLNAIIDYKQALADLRRKTLWDFELEAPVQVTAPPAR
ncbi:TolC family protein [candidate division KSB1 bacterium]|nr:TolC family protein [bacterium]NUM67795.1 TolC family protein [candidate division KSB1 bacterium]